MFAVFLLWQRRLKGRNGDPLVDLSLFRQKSFVPGLLVLFLVQAALAGFLFVFALHFESGLGDSVLVVGLGMVPPGFGYAATSLLSPILARKIGTRMIGIGLIGLVVGYGSLALLTWGFAAHLSPAETLVSTLIFGISMGLVFTPIMNMTLAKVPPELTGTGSGTVSTVVQLANVAGVAIIGSIFLSLSGHTSSESSQAFLAALVAICIMQAASLVAAPWAGRVFSK